jgi:hypothetical protein
MKSFTEGIKEKFENLADQTQDLAETAYKIAILEGTEQVTKVVSTTIVISLLLLLLNFLLLFLGLGVAWWIGDAMHDVKIGFFIVGGFYLLLVILILSLGKKLIIPFFRNMIIKKIYE